MDGLDPIVFGPRGEPVKCRHCGCGIRPLSVRPNEDEWYHLSPIGACPEGAEPPGLTQLATMTTLNRSRIKEMP